MPTLEEVLGAIPNRLAFAVIVLVCGSLIGFLVGRLNRQLMIRVGVPEAVEGTAFERTARRFGTSTVSIIAKLTMWFIIGVTLLSALSVADVNLTQQFLTNITGFIPELFVAILVLITGIIIGDKIELVISERLRGIKLPEIGILPKMVKYSVVFIAFLIALSQIGIATSALLVLLGIYGFAIVFLGGIAFKDLLASGAAGIYLLLNQPYGIGDEIRVDDINGIVQEMNVFVTRVENEDKEYILPNNRLFEHGVVRTRRN